MLFILLQWLLYTTQYTQTDQKHKHKTAAITRTGARMAMVYYMASGYGCNVYAIAFYSTSPCFLSSSQALCDKQRRRPNVSQSFKTWVHCDQYDIDMYRSNKIWQKSWSFLWQTALWGCFEFWGWHCTAADPMTKRNKPLQMRIAISEEEKGTPSFHFGILCENTGGLEWLGQKLKSQLSRADKTAALPAHCCCLCTIQFEKGPFVRACVPNAEVVGYFVVAVLPLWLLYWTPYLMNLRLGCCCFCCKCRFLKELCTCDLLLDWVLCQSSGRFLASGGLSQTENIFMVLPAMHESY